MLAVSVGAEKNRQHCLNYKTLKVINYTGSVVNNFG